MTTAEPILCVLAEKLLNAFSEEPKEAGVAFLSKLSDRIAVMIRRLSPEIVINRFHADGQEEVVPAWKAIENCWVRWDDCCGRSESVPMFAIKVDLSDEFVLDGPDELLTAILETAPQRVREHHRELSKPVPIDSLSESLRRLLKPDPKSSEPKGKDKELKRW